ncbi:DUF1120 domain-containing protein [Pseudomonas sp. B6002]|uniref:DUF1120 domain-containing protein n=1 Tax=Pseudomonas sp. B6002 TaxID=2726978 RepID=UPI0015A4C802|nr:DUF1120 domain-containing protein [Pseudomonas sp. B6002]NVZ49606.1 DUF1120 domain-containing protein [Pseudomonas sp. B6002]
MSITRNLLITALMMSAGHVSAASSVDLSVKGTITPSACTPTLGNGGVIDIGKISTKELNADRATHIPTPLIKLTVTCDAATLMAVSGKDNRAGTHFEEDNPYDFGLGLINGTEKLGGIELRVDNPIADGVAVRTIASDDGGPWYGGRVLATTTLISVANTGSLAPIPVQVLSADMSSYLSIAPTKNLTLDKEVAIDGSATITVNYL